jgi:1,4-dihydroxy-2-naphthoyl-CoA synthase
MRSSELTVDEHMSIPNGAPRPSLDLGSDCLRSELQARLCEASLVSRGPATADAFGTCPGATQLPTGECLTRTVGKFLAMDTILSGRIITAEEALTHGLAARIVPHESLMTEAVTLGKQIATKAPVAVRLAKESVIRGFEGRVDDGIEFERNLFYLLFATHDAHEGMHAFADKRQPVYEGC